MEESPSETHNYSGHPPTSQSRHPRTHPATRPPTLLPSLGDAALLSGMHAILCSTIHPMSAFASNNALNASRDRCDSHALRLGPHHASSRTAHRDARSTPHPSPPSTSPVRLESRLLLSSSHPVLHLHPFILDLSVLSSVVRYIQFVLLYVVSATVCCCLSLAFCCLSLFTAGLPLSAAAY